MRNRRPSRAGSVNAMITRANEGTTEFITGTFLQKHFIWTCYARNNASVRVLKKNGYEFVKEEFEPEDNP